MNSNREDAFLTKAASPTSNEKDIRAMSMLRIIVTITALAAGACFFFFLFRLNSEDLSSSEWTILIFSGWISLLALIYNTKLGIQIKLLKLIDILNLSSAAPN